MATSITADQLLVLPDDGRRYELVAGRLRRMSPSGGQHGFVAAAIAELLRRHVRRHRLGTVFGAETGFVLEREPDTVLAADVAFVARARLDPSAIPTGFVPFAPDLAVEVRSPRDSLPAIREKAGAWLRAGTRLCWTVDPDRGVVQAFALDGGSRIYAKDDVLEGGDVLPGFRLRVARLFEP